MQNRILINNQKRSLEVGIVDSVNITIVFALFLKETFRRFLEETGRFFMFPIAAVGSCIQAILAWRQAKIEKGKNGTVARAAVETLGAIAITTAVVGGFVAASLFATVAPIIFTVTMAAKTVFHAFSSIYYYGKSVATHDPEKKRNYRAAAKANAVGAFAGALTTVAVGFAMIAAKPILAILGVIAGAIGIGYSLYKRGALSAAPKTIAPMPASAAQEPLKTPSIAAPVPTNGARLHQRFNPISHGNSVSTSITSRETAVAPSTILQPEQAAAINFVDESTSHSTLLPSPAYR